MLSFCLAAWFLGALRLPNPKEGVLLKPFSEVSNGNLKEASGFVQSRTDPDIFWAHNDSGDVARIFAVKANGKTPVDGGQNGFLITNATHIDWEDIACDDNRLFVCDLGNNLNRRRDLGIYEVPEPKAEKSQPIQATNFFPVSYPDQTGFPPTDGWNFDCEAAFFWNGKLYVITKSRPAFRIYVQGRQAGLYRLDTFHTDQTNVLTKVDQAEDLGGWVTSADTSQDGRYLAVLVESPVQSVWLYEKPTNRDRFFTQAASVKRKVFHGGGQLEALAFHQNQDGAVEILLLNEARQLFRLGLDEFTTP